MGIVLNVPRYGLPSANAQVLSTNNLPFAAFADKSEILETFGILKSLWEDLLFWCPNLLTNE